MSHSRGSLETWLESGVAVVARPSVSEQRWDWRALTQRTQFLPMFEAALKVCQVQSCCTTRHSIVAIQLYKLV